MVTDAEARARIEAYLEPEGFELSNDPKVRALQILHSAAGIPFDPRPTMPQLWRDEGDDS